MSQVLNDTRVALLQKKILGERLEVMNMRKEELESQITDRKVQIHTLREELINIDLEAKTIEHAILKINTDPDL